MLVGAVWKCVTETSAVVWNSVCALVPLRPTNDLACSLRWPLTSVMHSHTRPYAGGMANRLTKEDRVDIARRAEGRPAVAVTYWDKQGNRRV